MELFEVDNEKELFLTTRFKTYIVFVLVEIILCYTLESTWNNKYNIFYLVSGTLKNSH